MHTRDNQEKRSHFFLSNRACTAKPSPGELPTRPCDASRRLPRLPDCGRHLRGGSGGEGGGSGEGGGGGGEGDRKGDREGDRGGGGGEGEGDGVGGDGGGGDGGALKQSMDSTDQHG